MTPRDSIEWVNYRFSPYVNGSKTNASVPERLQGALEEIKMHKEIKIKMKNGVDKKGSFYENSLNLLF